MNRPDPSTAAAGPSSLPPPPPEPTASWWTCPACQTHHKLAWRRRVPGACIHCSGPLVPGLPGR